MSRGRDSRGYTVDQVTRARPGQARPAATIQDVARAAGVGRQTVSNVLNGSGRVGEATRARVLEAVTALGYQPHHGARSLRSRRTRQLAYVLPRIQLLPGNHIMQQFLQSLAEASARQGHSVLVTVPDGDPLDEIRRLIASRTVDAFLLSELQPDDPRVLLLAEARVPFACFGRIGPGLPQHWVDIDNHAAIVGAVEHVLARGFGRLAFVGYRTASHWDLGRVSGFKAGLARHGDPRRRGRRPAGGRGRRAPEDPVAAHRRAPGQPGRRAAGCRRHRQRPAGRRGLRGRGRAADTDRP